MKKKNLGPPSDRVIDLRGPSSRYTKLKDKADFIRAHNIDSEIYVTEHRKADREDDPAKAVKKTYRKNK